MRRLLCAAILIASAVFSVFCQAQWIQDTQPIMGTDVTVELWSVDKKSGEEAVTAVMQEMRRIDAWLSPHIESSELSLVNRQAGLRPTKISKSLFQLIKTSLTYSRLSDGAFDITFAALGNHYHYRESKKPNDQLVESTLSAINFQKIQLDNINQTIKFLMPGMAIDLGGIAKGYAVDLSIQILLARHIDDAIVSAGGDSRIIGMKNGKPWLVGIQDPRDQSKVAIMIPLDNAAMSTSGDYQRFFMSDGVRYHHIINPSTGRSANSVRSVSIIGDTAIETDALSTTIFVMGVKQGLVLINRIDGVDAVIIDYEGKMHYSEGLLRAAP